MKLQASSQNSGRSAKHKGPSDLFTLSASLPEPSALAFGDGTFPPASERGQDNCRKSTLLDQREHRSKLRASICRWERPRTRRPNWPVDPGWWVEWL
jgi:hypothetical protein